jgi:uncharacterized protein
MTTNPLLAMLDRLNRRLIAHDFAAVPVATHSATVITGASEGIGLALARRFAKGGHTVVLVARREALLSAAAAAIRRDFGTAAFVVTLDVNSDDAGASLEAALAAHGLHAEILINNAGFGLSGEFHTMPEADIAALLSCNVAALTRLSRHFLPALIARQSGGLINVASVAAFTPGPYQAAYYASKAYVVALTRALRFETRGLGIRVAVVAPGPVETRFHARMNAESSLYRFFVPSPSAEQVADATFDGYRWHRGIIIPGLSAKALALILRVVPAFLSVPVVGYLLYPRVAADTNVPHDQSRQGNRQPGGTARDV